MRLAYDYQTMRRFDVDGRLHVLDCRISKANVCPYYGREIPGAEQLGLDPDRVYQLYRDPAELERAAPTFANLQLLMAHIPVNAEDPQTELTVGTLGSDVRFEAPYLVASLAIWTAEAIALVESRAQAQLSCSYRYTAVMDPGKTPDGVAYDGRMCNIVGNHVALVEEGRAGPDVVVNDAIFPSEVIPVKYAKILAAIKSFLKPDAQPVAVDAAIGAALTDAPQSMVFARVMTAIRPFLKPDTDAFQLASDGAVEKAIDAEHEEKKKADDEEKDDDEKKADDAYREAEDMYHKAADMEGEEAREMYKKASDKYKEAHDRGHKKGDEMHRKAKDAAEGVKPGPREGETGAALDAAIAAGRVISAADAKALADAAVLDATARINALNTARKDVESLVGVVALDSADDVYRFALDKCGVSITGVHPSAYPSLIEMYKTRRREAAVNPVIAADARNAVAEAIPGLGRIVHA